MATSKSAEKRARQNTVRRTRNKSVKTRIKHITKDVRSVLEKKPAGDATDKLSAVQSVIDKAARKGIIHRRAAARKISRLSKLSNAR